MKWKLKDFALRSGATQRCWLSPPSFNTALKVLARTSKRKKCRESKREKEEMKLSLFVDDIILHIKKNQILHHKVVRINKFQQSSKIQSQYAKISSIVLPISESSKKETNKATNWYPTVRGHFSKCSLKWIYNNFTKNISKMKKKLLKETGVVTIK